MYFKSIKKKNLIQKNPTEFKSNMVYVILFKTCKIIIIWKFEKLSRKKWELKKKNEI